MKREFLGQPVWLWAAGAVLIVGGYWYFSHKSATSSGSSTGAGAGGTEKSSNDENLKETITDWQGGGSTSKKTGHGDKAGPERQWLIHKTGSQHPWSFLARHHERIEVGPTGSRTIIKDK